MTYFNEWGFMECPFEASPLTGTKEGSQLLVGRDAEVKKFHLHLSVASKMVAIEGDNGMGKTSLTNVAIYRSLQHHFRQGIGPVYVPCIDSLRYDPDGGVDSFLSKIYIRLAQTIVKAKETFLERGLTVANSKPIERWKNSREASDVSVALNLILGKIEYGARNGSQTVYPEERFFGEVEDCLTSLFPMPTMGGIVCVIENAELIAHSVNTLHFFEELRDHIVRIPGVRWVVCGSGGVVSSIARSQRMDGYLHAPIPVKRLRDDLALNVFETRKRVYSFGDEEAFLPLTPVEFVMIYHVMRENLRMTLSKLSDYCLWVQARYGGRRDLNISSLFREWLDEVSEEQYRAVEGYIDTSTWSVLDKIADNKGFINAGRLRLSGADHEARTKQSNRIMVALKQLSMRGVLSKPKRGLEDGDKIYELTSNGNLVVHFRRRSRGISRSRVN